METKPPPPQMSPLMAHGNNILLPVRKYYNDQFIDENWDCYQMREILEAAQIFDPIFWVNNQLLTLWMCLITWLKNWKCLDSVTLIKISLKSWRMKCPSLLNTPRPIMTWIVSHQCGSIRPKFRRGSSGRNPPKILFWNGKSMRVSMHNEFGSDWNQGKINILTMEFPFASLLSKRYWYVQRRECFQSWRRSEKSRVKIRRKICVKSACFWKWMETWMICTLHLY